MQQPQNRTPTAARRVMTITLPTPLADEVAAIAQRLGAKRNVIIALAVDRLIHGSDSQGVRRTDLGPLTG